MSQTTSIFIVDDQPMIREGLLSFLKDNERFNVIGTAKDGMEAMKRLKSLDVDIVLTDIQMPRKTGIEFTEELLKIKPEQKIIVLTMFSEAAYIKKLLHLGVAGYILKDIDKQGLFNAIDMVMNGGQYYSAEITEVIMNKLRGISQNESYLASELTEREKEILHLILKQKSNQEIADELFISPRTVEAHKRNMLSKTGSKNLAGLVIYALDNKIFPDF